jgi:hypothetical protein
MSKKRNRRKQTTTLDARLCQFRNNLQLKARKLQVGCEEARQLQRRIQLSEAAL